MFADPALSGRWLQYSDVERTSAALGFPTQAAEARKTNKQTKPKCPHTKPTNQPKKLLGLSSPICQKFLLELRHT